MTGQRFFLVMAVLVWMAATISPADAQQQITPPSPILVNSPVVTINNSVGDQTDAHVGSIVPALRKTREGRGTHIRRFCSATLKHGAAAPSPC